MHKITAYIKNGKGIGASLLFVLSVFVAFRFAYNLNTYLPQAVPYVQNLADEFLPIKVENGKVTEPFETLKTHSYQLGKDHVVLMLDTTKDVLEDKDMKQGVFLTRSYLYTINGEEVRRQALKGNFYLEKKDYTPLMQTLINRIVWGVVLIGPLFYLAVFLIAVLIYAFCTGLSCLLNKTILDFKTKMRLNAVLFVGLYVFVEILSFIGLNISTFGFFLAMIAAQLVTVKQVGN